MKRIFALLLALVLVLSLAACGGANGDKPPAGGNDNPGTSQQQEQEQDKTPDASGQEETPPEGTPPQVYKVNPGVTRYGNSDGSEFDLRAFAAF